jgi:hypothetical protein
MQGIFHYTLETKTGPLSHPARGVALTTHPHVETN